MKSELQKYLLLLFGSKIFNTNSAFQKQRVILPNVFVVMKCGHTFCWRNVNYKCLKTECSGNILNFEGWSGQFMILHNEEFHDSYRWINILTEDKLS